MGKHRKRVKPRQQAQARSAWQHLMVPGAIVLMLAVGVATWFFLQKPTPVSVAAQYQGGPRLAVDRELIDFGSVRFEKFVTASFRLRNVGDQPLRLDVDPQVEALEGC